MRTRLGERESDQPASDPTPDASRQAGAPAHPELPDGFGVDGLRARLTSVRVERHAVLVAGQVGAERAPGPGQIVLHPRQLSRNELVTDEIRIEGRTGCLNLSGRRARNAQRRGEENRRHTTHGGSPGSLIARIIPGQSWGVPCGYGRSTTRPTR